MISFDSFVISDGSPIYMQILRYIQRGAAAGRITDGDELPSRRVLSALLGINPNTVQKAYQELERRNIIYSVAGKGSFIAPNQNANKVLLCQSVEKIQNAVREGRRAGMDRAQVEAAVEQVFQEEIQ